ncbi:DUF433 domain-containing protein [Candidatus Daviesbacteria bacterium]|nr:DUF433 domain-containing protein [Candidatus Daviesbacteria bacterium]
MKTRIIKDPRILAGKPTVAGTRIPVTLVLNLLAHGQTFDDILKEYPSLTHEDIKAVIKYAEKTIEQANSKDSHLVITTHEVPRR